jgi:Tfp pilus assembly protein PilF
MASTILSRRSRPMMNATTIKPRSGNITEAQETLQRNISALADHERTLRDIAELALRKRRLAALQKINNLVDPNSMESFIKFAQERVDAALVKFGKVQIESPDAWEHMT